MNKTQLRQIIKKEIKNNISKENINIKNSNSDNVNEDIMTITLGIAGGLLLLKLFSTALSFIGVNAKLSKDQLKEINENVIRKAIKEKPQHLETFARFKREINEKIDSGEITKLIDIVEIVKEIK